VNGQANRFYPDVAGDHRKVRDACAWRKKGFTVLLGIRQTT